jgi:hypothetical protein
MEFYDEENSKTVHVYRQFMAGVTVDKAMAKLTLDNLHNHRIIRVP